MKSPSCNILPLLTSSSTRFLGMKPATAALAFFLACLALESGAASVQALGTSTAPTAAPSTNWTGLMWPKGWSAFPSPAQPTFDYAEALHKAFLYLRIQRSGNLTATDHIAWRSNSCFTCTVCQGAARAAFAHACSAAGTKCCRACVLGDLLLCHLAYMYAPQAL